MESHQQIRRANVWEPRRNPIVRGGKGQENIMLATGFRKGRKSTTGPSIFSVTQIYYKYTDQSHQSCLDRVKLQPKLPTKHQKKKKKTFNQVYLHNHTLAGLNYLNE